MRRSVNPGIVLGKPLEGLPGPWTSAEVAVTLCLEDRWIWDFWLAARMYVPDGTFVGGLTDPIPVTVSDAGVLSLLCLGDDKT